ncbi:MAG: tetratricopeptide repeat protein [Alphaproteobacteria bacterium]
MSLQNPKPPQSQLNNLLSYYHKKQYDNAEKLATSITNKYPTHEYAWKILAAVQEQTGRVVEAKKANLKALKIAPRDPEIHLCLGNNLNQLGDFEGAESSYKKAIFLKPDYVQAYYNLGFILKKMQRFDEAVSIYEKFIELNPNFALGYNSLGLTFMELGQLENAILNFKKAIAIKPDYSQAFFNLGNTFRDTGQKEEALENFKQAVLLKPDYSIAYNVLGITLVELGRPEESIENFKQSFLLNPSYEEAYNNMGNALKELGRFDESIDSFKKAIELKPDYAECYNNYGRTLMMKNNFKKAFELMEWRLQLEELNFIPLDTIKPRWDGRNNQKVFLLREQGIGDIIMFSSMIPELNSNLENVIFECDQRLVSLLKRSFPNNIGYVTDRIEVNTSDYDSYIPIGSLPLHFRKNLIDFQKTSSGWLQADIDKVKSIRKILTKNKLKKIVGISWKTSSLLTQSYLRNIELKTLVKNLKKLDIEFVNLQYGDVSGEIQNLRLEQGIEVHEIDNIDLFNDIDGLASIISACDYVISIDNLTPHLAGALGVSTKLLLPRVADERWGLETKKSYLYDSIDIYRQSAHDDWSKPLEKMAKDLKILLDNKLT